MADRGLTWRGRKPCEKCPYRVDAPRGLWHPDEFRDLLANEHIDPMAGRLGAVYACHKKNGDGCVGWLIDQRRRGLPSLALRIVAMRSGELVACLREADAGDIELFADIAAMCRANGVDPDA